MAFKYIILAALLGVAVANDLTNDQFQQECLQAHNEFRAKHGVPPMKLDQSAINFARSWASKLASSGQNMLKHSGNKNFGENLAWIPSTSCKQAVQMWYDEISDYDFNNPGFKSGTGHFTQVVWKDSVKLGCGVAKAPGATNAFVSCNYAPAGNFMGRFPQNVNPPLDGKIPPKKANSGSPTITRKVIQGPTRVISRSYSWSSGK